MATVCGAAGAKFLGPIIDALNHIPGHPDDFGYQVLITADAAFFLVGALLLIPLKTPGLDKIERDADQLHGQ